MLFDNVMIPKILINNFQHHPFLFIERKFCKHYFFSWAKNNISQRQSNQPFKHLFTMWLALVKLYFVKLCNTRKYDLPWSIKMYIFEKLQSFFYQHMGKLGWSSICLKLSQFEPEIMLDGILNFKNHFTVWYCIWY